ncbi:MAG: hypothetical protein HRU13_02495 [Phycisphaerales bacterium]|nr:hypothetical protein [Phycisphaerales bacterium]
MWQWIQNNIPLIIVIVSFGASGVGWLLQQLKQAQEKKKADQLRQRARLESLRTGRSEPSAEIQTQQTRQGPQPVAADTPRQRLEELAKRRQQEQRQRTVDQRSQLEEQLRRRREAIDAQRQRQQEQRRRQLEAKRTGRQQPQTGGRQPQRQQQAQRPSSRQRPAQRPAPQPAQRPADRRRSAPPSSPQRQARHTPEPVVAPAVESRRPRSSTPSPAPTTTHARPGIAAALGSGFDLRQAVIMREILDKPIGLRGPTDPGR